MFKKIIKRLFNEKTEIKTMCPYCGHTNMIRKSGIFRFFLAQERCWNCRLWIRF